METFIGKKILITGGLGFIGSHLAERLFQAGAVVTILDSLETDYGGNWFNIHEFQDQVTVKIGDVRDMLVMKELISDSDYVYHLAGQNDHVLSQHDPFPDIDLNIRVTTEVLEICKALNPTVRFIHASTRGVYGSVKSLPVNEDAPTNPKGIYEISKLTAEKICNVYHDIQGIKTMNVRISNLYGPRSQMKHSRFGVANWFIRLALENDTIKLFGGGQVLRDFLYIKDCAEALVILATHDAAYGQTFNIGVEQPVLMADFVKKVIEIAGTGQYESVPYTPERAANEPGDFYSDISKIRELTGWSPTTDLEQGICETIDFYLKNRNEYWSV